MIDVKNLVFSEFICTEEQAENFLQTITFPSLLIQFRKIIKQSTENEIDSMVKHISSISPSISEQTSRDMFRQTCQGTDEVYEKAMAKHIAEKDFSINNFLQYLSEEKQEQFVRALCSSTMSTREKASRMEPRVKKIRPA